MKIGEITNHQDGAKTGWIYVSGELYNFSLVDADPGAKRTYNVMAGKQELGAATREKSVGGTDYLRLWLYSPFWPRDINANAYIGQGGTMDIVVHPPRRAPVNGTAPGHAGSGPASEEPPPHPGQ